ncbi:hypothetical protein [Methylobacterium sp. 1030]|uniref:hypothetical protein n=1 Tax=Methylobacterium sp. 1030 TaxID=3156404 RepID=UPI0033946FD4
MSLFSQADRTSTVEISGLASLKIYDFIDVNVPGQGWPVRIRLTGVSDDGLATAKLDYIELDGTDIAAVEAYLADNPEVRLKEIDCKIDILKLLSHADQLEAVLPNAARLIGHHPISVE